MKQIVMNHLADQVEGKVVDIGSARDIEHVNLTRHKKTTPSEPWVELYLEHTLIDYIGPPPKLSVALSREILAKGNQHIIDTYMGKFVKLSEYNNGFYDSLELTPQKDL